MTKITLGLENAISLSDKQWVVEHPSLYKGFKAQLASWDSKLRKQLALDFPFTDAEEQLTTAENNLQEHHKSNAEIISIDLEHFYAFLQQVHQPNNRTYWDKELVRLRDADPNHQTIKNKGKEKKQKKKVQVNSAKISHQLLLNEWRKQFDQQVVKWELDTINKLRSQYLKKLEKWLAKLKEISAVLTNLGMEPGLLLDLSAGKLSVSAISQLKQWLEYLNQDSG